MFLVNVHTAVDEHIGGNWRDYPPFSFLEHPPLDTYLDAKTLVTSHGFELHDHWVTTDDGYIVNLVNLKPLNDTAGQKPVVLLAHGLADSSDAWLLNGRKKSLAFILSDAGYDVWMTNSRGNKYSEANHTTLTQEKDGKQLWSNMLIHDMATYDMPASVKYVKKVTGLSKISFVGHSQASQQMLYNLIKNREFFEQSVNFATLLSPYLSLTEVTAPLSTQIVNMASLLRPLAEYFNYFKFLAPEQVRLGFLYSSAYLPRIVAFI